MSMTEIGNWAVDLKDVGAIYPMQGMEVIMTVIGVVLWLGWHVWQAKHENAELGGEDTGHSHGGHGHSHG